MWADVGRCRVRYRSHGELSQRQHASDIGGPSRNIQNVPSPRADAASARIGIVKFIFLDRHTLPKEACLPSHTARPHLSFYI